MSHPRLRIGTLQMGVCEIAGAAGKLVAVGHHQGRRNKHRSAPLKPMRAPRLNPLGARR